jgi:hypothetical protein
MQKFTNSIKRPNLITTDIEEEEEVQAKGICNMFNKIENFPNQVQEASRIPNKLDQNRTSP